MAGGCITVVAVSIIFIQLDTNKEKLRNNKNIFLLFKIKAKIIFCVNFGCIFVLFLHYHNTIQDKKSYLYCFNFSHSDSFKQRKKNIQNQKYGSHFGYSKGAGPILHCNIKNQVDKTTKQLACVILSPHPISLTLLFLYLQSPKFNLVIRQAIEPEQ